MRILDRFYDGMKTKHQNDVNNLMSEAMINLSKGNLNSSDTDKAYIHLLKQLGSLIKIH